jgi:hypothetical protein
MAYRHLPIVKRAGGKIRRYKNLAAFGQECTKHTIRGNICELVAVRKLKDGGGLAVVRTKPGFTQIKQGGTWRLHFASYGVMKNYLRGRVIEDVAFLGARRRK